MDCACSAGTSSTHLSRPLHRVVAPRLAAVHILPLQKASRWFSSLQLHQGRHQAWNSDTGASSNHRHRLNDLFAATMSGKEAYNNYEDEIDLYGDAEAPAEEQREREKYGEEKSRRDDDRSDGKPTGNTIPTFISEARGGTGVLPPRDESGRSGNGEHGSSGAGGSGGDGVLPRRGDYGSPGQWSTKPVSTTRPSDMPEEGLVAFQFSFDAFSSRFLSLFPVVAFRCAGHLRPS